ncbi:MAG: hypothetical protein ACK5V3_00555 [Bdellovibrionales bacterium]
MKNSINKTLVILVSFLVASVTMVDNAEAISLRRGGMDGGGGNAVVCRNRDGLIDSAQLLDLYEGIAIWDLKPTQFDSKLDYKEIAFQVASRMRMSSLGQNLTMAISSHSDGSGNVSSLYFGVAENHHYDLVKESIERTLEIFRILPASVDLAPIPDSGHFILPRNCKVEQVAVYRDDLEKLFIVKDIWEAFDLINRAALITHEAVYKILRSPKEQNSNRTRLIVAKTFAGQNFKSLFEGVNTENMILCNSLDSELKHRFVLTKKLNNLVQAQFLMIDGLIPVTLTQAVFPVEYTPLSEIPSQIETEVNDYLADNLTESLNGAIEVFEIGVNYKPNQRRKFTINLSNHFSEPIEENEVEFECRNGGYICKETGNCSFWAHPEKIP